jgi:hypothetical protein
MSMIQKERIRLRENAVMQAHAAQQHRSAHDPAYNGHYLRNR